MPCRAIFSLSRQDRKGGRIVKMYPNQNVSIKVVIFYPFQREAIQAIRTKPKQEQANSSHIIVVSLDYIRMATST